MITCKPHGIFPCPDCGTVHYEGCPCSLCKHGKPLPTQLDRIEAAVTENGRLIALLMAPKPRKPSKPRTSNAEYQEWFEDTWKEYPQRSGANPKKRAYSAWCQRNQDVLDTLHGPQTKDPSKRPTLISKRSIIAGTIRYAKFCDATGKIGTEFVMQAVTFFGPEKHYENDWTLPKVKPTEDPNKQHHATYDPNAKVIIPKGGERDLT